MKNSSTCAGRSAVFDVSSGCETKRGPRRDDVETRTKRDKFYRDSRGPIRKAKRSRARIADLIERVTNGWHRSKGGSRSSLVHIRSRRTIPRRGKEGMKSGDDRGRKKKTAYAMREAGLATKMVDVDLAKSSETGGRGENDGRNDAARVAGHALSLLRLLTG